MNSIINKLKWRVDILDIEARIKEIEEENGNIVATINKRSQEIEQMKTVYTANLGRVDELKKFLEPEVSIEESKNEKTE